MALKIDEPCPACCDAGPLTVMEQAPAVSDLGTYGLVFRVQCLRCFQNFRFVTGDRSLTPVASLAPDEKAGRDG